MGNMINDAEQYLAEVLAEHNRLLLEKYLKMVGVSKHDFSNAFRKHLNIATGVDMDTALSTERIFNPSETKIARTLIDDMKNEEDIIYVIRSRSSSETEESKEAKEKSKEETPEEDVKESLLTMFEKKFAPKEEEPKEEPKKEKDEYEQIRDFASDGHSNSGSVSDDDAKSVVDKTTLEHFFILTNMERLGKRIAPDIPSPPAMHLYMIDNLVGDEDKPLKATTINATLSVLVEMLRNNTSTVNFVYKFVVKKEHAKNLKVKMKIVDDNVEGEKAVAPSDADDTSQASAQEMDADKVDDKSEDKTDDKPDTKAVQPQSALVANPLDTAHQAAAEPDDKDEDDSEEDDKDSDDDSEEDDDKKTPTFPLKKKKVPEGYKVGGKFTLTEDIGTYDDSHKFVLGLRKGAIVEMVDLMTESALSTVKVKHITNREVFTVEMESIEGYGA